MAERIVTVCLRGFPGADRLLTSLQRTTGLTRHISVAGPVPGGPEAEFVAHYIAERRPDLVVFGAWSPLYAKLLDDLEEGPTRFAVYWTSSVGQTGLSEDLVKLADVLREPRIAHLLFCSEAFYLAVHPHFRGARYVPPTYRLPSDPAQSTRVADAEALGPGEPTGLRISLFSPAQELGRKNVLNCLLALAGLPRDYTLYLNGLTQQPAYADLVAALEIPHRELGWMERDLYERVLDGIELGLQPSFSESFSYIAAEHLVRGIPVVGTSAVPVLSGLSPDIRERLVVGSPDDPADIRRKVEFLLRQADARAEIGERARRQLLDRIQEDNERAGTVLEELLNDP